MAATVEVAHGLCFIAFTTTNPKTAIKMIIITKVPMSEATPASGLNSSFAICPKLFPFFLTEKKRIVISCTAPPTTAPIRIQIVPGRYPNCAASVGPISGPGPAIAAK